jgi:hypothetical protein
LSHPGDGRLRSKPCLAAQLQAEQRVVPQTVETDAIVIAAVIAGVRAITISNMRCSTRRASIQQRGKTSVDCNMTPTRADRGR